ncbi:MAG: transporter substrate-binding domain-containing protein [Bacteroides sp.]|nr:transporter substrate-binding domain-containing protein [Eubacterium sp.]MCM1417394.1 transporter substrate-binding domain-containing protein [Roseburia sp.]MCM1461413.1 transporter substrate-binding domain-containing protein [Bacteroides sp.]
MKMFKKIAAAFAALGLIASAGCAASDKTDWEYIADKGELVIGITLFEPMNYYDENGELTGFETEFAEALCAKLGVTPKFQEIDWNQKETELKSKAIDCIWNGLTVTEDRKENMAFTDPYVDNRQVLVIRKENADKYVAESDLAGVKAAAESGSAGETAIAESAALSTGEFIGCAAQKDALLEVKAGTADVCVIDYVMATGSIREDSDYADLMVVEGVQLAPEQYAIGLRLEDTATVAKFNETIKALADEGTLQALAEKYGLLDVLAY